MPAWLLPVLLNVGKFVLHALQRFWSVFLIGAIIFIISTRYIDFKKTLYEQGYKVGYSQALTDHPSVVVQSGGVMNSNVIKTVGIDIDGFGFGFWHRR